MKITGIAKTDVGKLRTENQDAFGFWPEDNLFFVCDGMGGGVSGDFASKMAVDVIYNSYKSLKKDDINALTGNKFENIEEKILKPAACLKLANRQLWNLQKKYPKLKGMGTTAVGAFFEKEKALLHIYNVGDSRIYRIRNGIIKQLTQDHSKVQELIALGKMTETESKTAEFQSMITRALGTAEKLKVDYKAEIVKHGDVYVFCSDGLNGELDDDHIKDIVCLNKPNLENIASELILAANNAGGRDNTTVIVLAAEDDEQKTNIPQDYQEDILVIDEEKQTEILKEDSVIKNIEKNFKVEVPKGAKKGKIYTNPLLLALCVVLLCLIGFSFFSSVTKEEEKKDIAELTGKVSGIQLTVKTIKEEKLKEISSTEDRITKMQTIQEIISDADNLIPLTGTDINIISLSDGQQQYSGVSDTSPLEINLPNDKYEISLNFSGYKVLDKRNINLTDSIEIQTQNSTNLTDVEIVMVPETLFENNDNFQENNENLENTENE
jgi:protein phosphatase